MCQKPPSPIEGDRARFFASDVEGRGRGRPEPIAHGGGADIEGRHDREQMAADIGGDVVRAELLLDQLHRGEDRPLRTADAEAGRARRHRLRQIGDVEASPARSGARRGRWQQVAARSSRRKAPTPSSMTCAGIFAGHRAGVLAEQPGRSAGLVQHRAEGLLDVVRLAFLDHQHRVLARAEVEELVVDQRIGDVQHIERHVGAAADVGEAEALQRADDAVVHAALHDDADAAVGRAEDLVQLALADEFTAAGQRFVTSPSRAG